MNNQLFFSSNDQTWETPIQLFNKLNTEFNFTVDVCAGVFTFKCKNFYTETENGLEQDWSNDICWMNPPYDQCALWLKKAYEESLRGATVVALIPARTDTKYWHDYCMNASEIRFIKGRLKFGSSTNSAPFPSAIIVFNNSSDTLTISAYDRGYLVPLRRQYKKAIRKYI